MLSVIIVTYNSSKFLKQCLKPLLDSESVEIIVVDNNSDDKSYLYECQNKNIKVYELNKNIGFGMANNLGFSKISSDSKYVLFLNHDVFLSKAWIKEAMEVIEASNDIGVYSSPLYGFDIEQMQPSGKIDSLGIGQNWFGRWYDIGQGMNEEDVTVKNILEPKAICGALMMISVSVLDQVKIGNSEVFDKRFFMYKEDIDLSLRIKKIGYRLVVAKGEKNFHCRGWNSDRRLIERRWKMMSVKNEILLHIKHKSIGIFFSFLKYIGVSFFNK